MNNGKYLVVMMLLFCLISQESVQALFLRKVPHRGVKVAHRTATKVKRMGDQMLYKAARRMRKAQKVIKAASDKAYAAFSTTTEAQSN